MDRVREMKSLIRKQMRELRKSTVASQAAEAEVIISHIMQLPQWQEADTVLLYSSLKGEVDSSRLLQTVGKRLVLPVVEGEFLMLREYRKELLEEGYQGILEPSSEAPSVKPSEIDLALIPGVAFDRMGHRLGRGKGFYDRLLPQLDCPKIGMGFSWQVIDTIPVESHDITLDGTVTPEGLLKA